MKVTVFQFPCRARRLLSRRKLWRDRRTRRVYRVSSIDAAWRKRRQSAFGKDRELSRLCASRGKSGPDRNRLPGCHHAWTVPGLVPARFYRDYVSTTKCPLIQLGPNPPAFLIDGQAKPFDPNAFAACVAEAPGYSMGFDATIRTQSLADAARLLQRNLQP